MLLTAVRNVVELDDSGKDIHCCFSMAKLNSFIRIVVSDLAQGYRWHALLRFQGTVSVFLIGDSDT